MSNPVPADPQPTQDASSSDLVLQEKLMALEADVRSLKGKGLALSIIAALLGSGGVTAIATIYLNARSVAIQQQVADVQREQARSQITQQALQNKQIEVDTELKKNQTTQQALQNRQIEVDTELKKQTLAAEHLKADQASFEATMKAFAMTLDRLKQERAAAVRGGDSQRVADLDRMMKVQREEFRKFIELSERLAREQSLPGWYQLGLEEARRVLLRN